MCSGAASTARRARHIRAALRPIAAMDLDAARDRSTQRR
jgi:hypothetical protein